MMSGRWTNGMLGCGGTSSLYMLSHCIEVDYFLLLLLKRKSSWDGVRHQVMMINRIPGVVRASHQLVLIASLPLVHTCLTTCFVVSCSVLFGRNPIPRGRLFC